MPDITPLIVLGSARCGTTSLSNYLCQHPNIAGVQSDEHWGIKECPFLCDWRNYYGKFTSPERFIAVFEQFSAADYFRASGVERKGFLDNPPASWPAFVRRIMNRYARDQQAGYWLIKSPRQTMYVEELQEVFPDARFVLIRRNLRDVVQSNIKRAGNESGFWNIGKRVFRYQSDFRAVDRTRNQLTHFAEVEFESFINRTDETLRTLLEELDISWDESVLDNPYRVDSSFRDEPEERSTFLSKSDRFYIWFWSVLLSLIPFGMMYFIRRAWDERRVTSDDAPPLYFRLHPHAEQFCGKRFQREDRENE